MNLKFLLSILLMRSTLLYSNETTYTPYSLEKEYEALIACAKHPTLPLSEALKELTVNVTDLYYKPEFYEKLAKAEKAKFDGEYVDHWENGQLKIKATLKKGIVDGHVHGWYPDGKESFKAYYDNGKKIGIHIAFFPIEICRAKSRGTMGRYLIFNREGKLDGHQFTDTTGDRLSVSAHFKNGILDGKKEFYDGHGKILQSWTYKKGKLISKFEDKSQAPKPS